ncbi:hypothetical protein Taro_046760 [Colocasia esculenta]|uniref:Uncharacterized protein n=1 Tax=Colocasia esculenta TaxID=4460 RepID=A0A843WQW2_COLES|nr:hypothetical protein [Colocasia esculenta]
MLTTHTAGNARRTSRHHDRSETNSGDNESLLEESRGGLPVPYQQEQHELQQRGSKTTLQSSKARNTYCRVLQSSGNRVNASTTTRQHNAEANPRHTPAETKKLTEDRSNHERPESHDTSTNIPDLHKVGKEQPGVTTRDTKQPCEKQHLTTCTATSDLHKVEGPQAEPTCTSNTPRGQGTTPTGATTNGTKERVTEIAVGCLHKTPRKNPQNGNHYTRPTRPTDKAQGSETRLGYNHRVNQGNKNTSSETA